MARPKTPLHARFWSMVDTAGECWEWRGPRRGGYGVIEDAGKTLGAHRVSYELAHGRLPAGHHICHSCDNRGCVNPAHLFLGTPSLNARDMVEKGRQAFGTRNAAAKLTEQEVREIKSSMLSQRAMARKYGITQANVSSIRLGKTWAHVEVRDV